jgi:hypothetical protein
MFDENYFFTMIHLNRFIGEYTVLTLDFLQRLASHF